MVHVVVRLHGIPCRADLAQLQAPLSGQKPQAPSPAPPRATGLDNIVSMAAGPRQANTLDKTRTDWSSFKAADQQVHTTSFKLHKLADLESGCDYHAPACTLEPGDTGPAELLQLACCSRATCIILSKPVSNAFAGRRTRSWRPTSTAAASFNLVAQCLPHAAQS